MVIRRSLPIHISQDHAVVFRLAEDLLAGRRPADASVMYDRAQILGANTAACAAGRWMCWMLLGDFSRAWRESDMIDTLRVEDEAQLWDGAPFERKRVMVRCLHGFGDAIQFVRYAKLLRTQAARVIVQAHPALVKLLRLVHGVDRAITWPDLPNGEREWDQQIEVMELPRAFRTTIETVPSAVPYISIPPAHCEAARRKLGPARKLRVGVVWQSSAYDPTRDVSAEGLITAISPNCCELYSFQHGLSPIEASELGAKYPIHDAASLCDGIVETGAMMLCMDLIISVDTFAAHLAGALALPVWVMLPFAADWRWMINRDESPWYPSMRLFRQDSPGDWRPVIELIRMRLKSLIDYKTCKFE